ncbi:MAG: hypothetical protein IKU26_08770 [Clostridia bacterium]|nr:hypothetical protein [Clostridia bacterium]
MRRGIALLCCFMIVLGFGMNVSATTQDATSTREIQPGSWTAVDGLGRTLSSSAQVGEPDEEKYVGMFYWNWHTYFSYAEPRNITQIIKSHPEAQNDIHHAAWGENNVLHPYFWDEPLLGYYRTDDAFVLRKHAELLADAGVDYIVFDCSNGTEIFKSGCEDVLEAFAQAKEDGVNVPKISFLLSWYDTNCRVQLKRLYKSFYTNEEYRDLWFCWEGKPLMIAHTTAMDPENEAEAEMLDFFTFRHMRASYFDPQYAYEDKVWGWCSVYPQTKFGVKQDGSVEMMCVSVAQNANETTMTAMNDPKGGVRGRGYAVGDYAYSYTYKGETVTVNKQKRDAYIYGLNFQQQWDYAIEQDPQVIFVTGWNEYVAQLQEEFQGVQCAFSDNFTAEYSRDIEPSAGILKDHYYNQLVENIRRFKGTATQTVATEEHGVNKTVKIDGNVTDWQSVSLAYAHYTNSAGVRDNKGYDGTYYENKTLRNDITQAKVAYDQDNLYFLVETKDAITAPGEDGWMRLYMDTDITGLTPNWEGFEYVINRTLSADGRVTVEKSTGGWNFTAVGTGTYAVSRKCLEVAIPRSSLGLADTQNLTFNFKWADNAGDGEILDFYQYGDVAPGGRFAFHFTTVASEAGKLGRRGTLWWIVGIGAGVVLIAAVPLMLIKKKKK